MHIHAFLCVCRRAHLTYDARILQTTPHLTHHPNSHYPTHCLCADALTQSGGAVAFAAAEALAADGSGAKRLTLASLAQILATQS